MICLVKYGDPDMALLTSRGPDHGLQPDEVRWASVNSGGDEATICPSDPLFLNGGGTYYGEVYGFLETEVILIVR